MKKWTLMAAVALTLSACGGSEENRTPAARTAPAGEQLVLTSNALAGTKTVAGEITTRDQSQARARIPGLLVVLSVREGDRVSRGQQIGRVVDDRIGFETRAYDAQVAAAEAEATRARADLTRIQDLYDHNIYARARLDQAVAAARAADAQAAAARAQRGASASMAGQGAILAPAAGRVLKVEVTAGSAVSPGMSIATITAGPPVLRLELPESLAGQVKPGARVLLAADDLPAEARQGQVTQVYPAVVGGRVQIDAAVPGLTTELVGRRVAASIEIGQRQALTVPRRFVATRYGLDYVEVVSPDRRRSAVPVQTAPTDDPDTLEILSGVRAGDRLVATRTQG